eukprot:TRINITY_DN8708_c0_g1_i2.p1 TRINITY_DN8708_c0_g1~~TRINITY_DN8708_c0_g1_i2.p1  ORF type:complete len:143 (+),score=17.80 TRINITY_DN8708_c0_g1_i2:3-431(+)
MCRPYGSCCPSSHTSYVQYLFFFFFFFKQKTAYEIMPSLVGSEMCIRDRYMGGVTQWAKKYGVNMLPSPLPPTEDPTKLQMPYCTRQTSDGGYIIAGQLSSKCYLLKIDAAGAVTWAYTYADNSCGNVVKQTADGYLSLIHI